MKPSPENDGVDHINVYAKGKTELGRLLSNFAHTPFTLDGQLFASVEAWWYWQSLKAYDILDMEMPTYHGVVAKYEGRAAHGDKVVIPPTRDALARAYAMKVVGNPRVRELLLASTLPFDHYYVYQSRRTDTHWRWTGQLWNDVREGLRKAVSHGG